MWLTVSNRMKVAIVAAMKPELDELVSRLRNRDTVKRAGFDFHTGVLAGHDVILLLSGVGKVNAAVGTALVIEDYAPDVIINTGVAGGFDPAMNPGDIVLSTEVRHHDVDARPFGYESGQVPGMPAVYHADPQLMEKALSVAGKAEGVTVKSGLVVSGDIFIHEPEEARDILRRFPSALAGEMEAAAVAQVCHLFSKPFIITRSISDVIGSGGNHMEYEEFLPLAAARSVEFVIGMLEEYL